MFYHFILTLHVSACLLMILVVLLQTGRGAGLSVFGGSDSLITTPTGSSFMRKLTATLAGTFAFTSLFLALLSSRGGSSSVMSHARPMPPPPPAASAPATPAQAPAPAPVVPK